MNTEAETLAKMLEELAEQPHDVAGAQDDIREAAALIRQLSERVVVLEAGAEKTLLEVIDERDIAEASAQKLADLVARITDEDIGEYSAGLGCPGNDPILNAVDAAERYIARAALSPQKDS